MRYRYLLFCAAAGLLVACTPVTNQRGYLEDKDI